MQKRLNAILDDFSKAKLLCVGDMMIDRFVQGKVERISPEAPVPVFQFVNERQMLGGAGNVVANLRALGASVYFMGMVGKDKYGTDVADLLNNIAADFYLIKSRVRPTIMKARFIAGSNHILRFDQEKIIPLTGAEEKELLAVLKKRLSKTDIVLLSDYAKGLFSTDFTQQVISLCNEFGKHVLVDPKGADYSQYAGCFLIKPNRKELELASGRVLNPEAADFLVQVEQAARLVLERYAIDNMIVTLSEKGMLYISSDAAIKPIYLATYAREVFDVSGAGDTSLSVLGTALGVGASMNEAMELANQASGIVVGKLGTATVTVQELKEALTQGDA